MTCKDCIHHGVCYSRICVHMDMESECAEVEERNIENFCKNYRFKFDGIDVVKCKDCRFSKLLSDAEDVGIIYRYCMNLNMLVQDESFCSYGFN